MSDHYDGVSFFNPGNIRVKKKFKDLLKMLFSKPKVNDWPNGYEIRPPRIGSRGLAAGEAYITYINHACHLIQVKGLNIITDPIFSKRAGPALTGLGPNRVRDPGLPLKKLPKIDVVLVSHNHYDHMDLPSLSKLKKRFNPVFIVPLGNKKYLQKRKIENIVELDWWESYEIQIMKDITRSLDWFLRYIGHNVVSMIPIKLCGADFG